MRLAAHRSHPLDERDQLGDVVAVVARDSACERDTSGVDQEVVFGACSDSINGAALEPELAQVRSREPGVASTSAAAGRVTRASARAARARRASAARGGGPCGAAARARRCGRRRELHLAREPPELRLSPLRRPASSAGTVFAVLLSPDVAHGRQELLVERGYNLSALEITQVDPLGSNAHRVEAGDAIASPLVEKNVFEFHGRSCGKRGSSARSSVYVGPLLPLLDLRPGDPPRSSPSLQLRRRRGFGSSSNASRGRKALSAKRI